MTAGQAAGIAASSGLSSTLTIVAVAAFSVANMTGGLAAGWAADCYDPHRLIVAIPLGSALAAMLLMLSSGTTVVLVAIAGLGFCYGAFIGIYPAAVGSSFGIVAATRIYGRVFTAWGLAGLIAPFLAASLYDASGNYTVALAIAAVISVAAALVALAFRIGAQ